jgi:hypothetical protein
MRGTDAIDALNEKYGMTQAEMEAELAVQGHNQGSPLPPTLPSYAGTLENLASNLQSVVPKGNIEGYGDNEYLAGFGPLINGELPPFMDGWGDGIGDGTNPHSSRHFGGGQISEPIMGIGRSGRTYSFGEHGAETITPNGQGGGGGITINIARIDKTADFEQLKPMIQRWILEANSRRGMI